MISLDSDTGITEYYGSGTASIYHTCSGSDRLLVVGMNEPQSSPVVSVTYNTVPMASSVIAVNSGLDIRMQIWTLLNPDIGNNEILITKGGILDDIFVGATSFNGVSQVGLPDATSTVNNSGATVTGHITTISDNCLVYAVCGRNYSSAGTGSIKLSAFTSYGAPYNMGVLTSSSVLTPPGIHNMSFNTASGQNIVVALMSFAPSASAPNTSSLSFLLNFC